MRLDRVWLNRVRWHMRLPSTQSMKDGDHKKNEKHNVVGSTVELIVTPAIRAPLERKRLRHQKNRLLAGEIHGTERGEIDLGDLDAPGDTTEQ
ncbi:MAG: hypothetical protein ACRD4C_04490 [Candidatus Acidiferrales bacterium]